MTLGSKEFYEVIEAFEKSPVSKSKRLDKEPKELWKKGQIYQNGEVNDLFKCFQHGYSYAKAVYQ